MIAADKRFYSRIWSGFGIKEMPQSHEEFLEIANRLKLLATAGKEAVIEKPLAALEHAANTVGRAWSGSWLGYHSCVYYVGLKPPPRGSTFQS
jgi:hypothetical protein